MKRKLKIFILVATLTVALIGSSTLVFAARSFKQVLVSTSWTTIAYDTDGFDCNVKITGMLTSVGQRIDVRMLGKNNNVVWSEDNSCPGLASRVYRCGPDVYKIEVRVSPGIQGTAIAILTDKPAN